MFNTSKQQNIARTGCLILAGTTIVCAILGSMIIPFFGVFLGGFCGFILGSRIMSAYLSEKLRGGKSRPNPGGGGRRTYEPRGDFEEHHSAGMSRELFVSTLVEALSNLAAADGQVSAKEIKLISVYVAELFPEVSTETVKESFRRAMEKRGTYSFVECCRRLKEMAGYDLNASFNIMELFCELAFCDNSLSPEEQRMLQQAEMILGIPGFLRLFMARKQYRNSGEKRRDDDECLRILGCAPDATDADIKKAWRSLCHKYHPDKLEGQGATPEEIKEAQDKMQRINEAYESLKASRGMA